MAPSIKPATSQFTIFLTLGVLFFGYLLRAIVSRTDQYSGHGNPPMYGDFEAHRHWMEITTKTPVRQWYTNTEANNLTYWGLDYPPLSAYHAFIVGKISEFINPKWTELKHSAGLETDSLTAFMRTSVFLTEQIFLLPGLILNLKNQNNWLSNFAVCMTYADLILVDYGHFQYNCLSIGLSLVALYFLRSRKFVSASITYSLALCAKQMSLYYCIPIGFYILSHAGLKSWAKCASSVLATFAIICLPYSGPQSISNLVKRVFPVERGLFEDKVANLWSCINVIIKVRSVIDRNYQILASFILTLFASAPTVWFCLRRRKCGEKTKLILLSHIVALSFFLFSFQVHEKSILFATIPLCLISDIVPYSTWMFYIAHLSLVPLYAKDKILLESFCIGHMSLNANILIEQFNKTSISNRLNTIRAISMFTGFLLAYPVPKWIRAPAKYPDLLVVALYSYCFLHFVLFLFWGHICAIRKSVNRSFDHRIELEKKRK